MPALWPLNIKMRTGGFMKLRVYAPAHIYNLPALHSTDGRLRQRPVPAKWWRDRLLRLLRRKAGFLMSCRGTGHQNECAALRAAKNRPCLRNGEKWQWLERPTHQPDESRRNLAQHARRSAATARRVARCSTFR